MAHLTIHNLRKGNQMDPDLIEELDKYPVNTAIIKYRLNGKEKKWAIGARMGADNEETLQKHLEKWYPKAKFLGWAIK